MVLRQAQGSAFNPQILLLLLVVSILPILSDASFSIIVGSDETECFVIRAPGKSMSTISGNYDVLDDELPPDPIAVTMTDSSDRILWKSDAGASEGTFQFTGKGRHKLCISNGRPTKGHGDDVVFDGRARQVGFAIRVRPPARALDGEEGPDPERALQLLESAENFMEGLETLVDHQQYLRNREEVHRALTEETFNRVVRWTVLEAVILCIISGGQVMYLRKFFETRRYL